MNETTEPEIKMGYICPECGEVADIIAEEHDESRTIDMKNGDPTPDYQTFENSMCTQCGQELPKESNRYYLPYAVIKGKVFVQADQICGFMD